MNIKYIRKIMILSAFGALLAGCDTSEDMYEVGDASRIKFDIDPEKSVTIGADGVETEILVSSNLSWTVEKADPSVTWYEVKQSSTKGDGKVILTADINETNARRTAAIIISGQGFSKSYNVAVAQSLLVFTMDTSKDFPVVPETGGTVELTYTSTIAWKLEGVDESKDKDLGEYFSNANSLNGAAQFDENLKFNVDWNPNYTPEERVVTLRLAPQNSDLNELVMKIRPGSFTLRQEAGTFPEISGIATVGTPTLTDAVLSVSYASKSPVTEVGVIINGSKVAAPAGTYQETGSVEIPLTGLASGHTYEATPYVVNRVGEKIGEQTASFTTERPVGGASIINVNVIPSYKSVQAEITVDSDCELVGGGFALYDVDNPNYQIVKYTTPLSGMSRTFIQESTDFMQQNTEYLLEPFVIYRHSKENVEIEVTGDKISFYTLFRIPEEDDNKPIE